MSEVPTKRSMWEPGMSFECPKCGDWLPTPEAYARFRGGMNRSHTCLCGASSVEDRGVVADRGEKA
jgi:hypothetical protein